MRMIVHDISRSPSPSRSCPVPSNIYAVVCARNTTTPYIDRGILSVRTVPAFHCHKLITFSISRPLYPQCFSIANPIPSFRLENEEERQAKGSCSSRPPPNATLASKVPRLSISLARHPQLDAMVVLR